ncbi:hypothetical protein [Methylobacter sp.]|uniref:hypothetical protein n=1 Tax=Methylobacter sp. TaxID=2051955 RepID=UPI00121C084C|nr:hypothetical protein [Methylobacter sp.]TAK62049.1 MAG: hypothetical protein EPO18_11860 [Methylobacter sp.]
MTNISTSSANQYGFQQLSAVMALRNVAQAEQVAQSLRARANDAQRVVDVAKENARALLVQSNQAQVRAENERQMLNTSNSILQAGTQLSNFVNHVIVPSSSTPSPLVDNSQPKAIGSIIDINA